MEFLQRLGKRPALLFFAYFSVATVTFLLALSVGYGNGVFGTGEEAKRLLTASLLEYCLFLALTPWVVLSLESLLVWVCSFLLNRPWARGLPPRSSLARSIDRCVYVDATIPLL